ncbi:MAG: glycosyltransferase family 1 protein [Verrucomicrobiota bacterium]
MKIVIIGNFRPDAQESMLRFAGMLGTGLGARGWSVVHAEPRPVFARLARPYRYGGLPKYLGYVDKFVLFPRALRRVLEKESPAAVHIVDHANAPYAAACGSRAVLTTCHDLLQIRAARGEIPQQRLTKMGTRYQGWILNHIGQSRRVACVSEETLHHLLRLAPLPRERVSVVPNALNYPYRPVPRAEAWRHVQRWPELAARIGADPKTGAGYLLNVGGGQWYKNRRGLLAIFAQLRAAPGMPQTLVMVGKPLSEADAALARQLGVDQDIVSVTGISNEDLQALYSAAEGLLFPSWEEGFGWPIAEAQACGCPVFTTNRAPMTDVGGDAAAYFDPTSEPSAAQRILAAWPTRPEMSARGLRAAKRWSLDTMLDRYEALYRELGGAGTS